jgi:hypothetical protein
VDHQGTVLIWCDYLAPLAKGKGSDTKSKESKRADGKRKEQLDEEGSLEGKENDVSDEDGGVSRAGRQRKKKRTIE